MTAESVCIECDDRFAYTVKRGSHGRTVCDRCLPVRDRRRKAEYKKRNRARVLADSRAYAERKRRAAGVPALGTQESRENRSRARKATGTAHGLWTGDDASYSSIHLWLARHKERTGICEWCGDRPFASGRLKNATQFANLSGEYRRDVDDYAELCPTCHVRFDRGLDVPERKAA